MGSKTFNLLSIQCLWTQNEVLDNLSYCECIVNHSASLKAVELKFNKNTHRHQDYKVHVYCDTNRQLSYTDNFICMAYTPHPPPLDPFNYYKQCTTLSSKNQFRINITALGFHTFDVQVRALVLWHPCHWLSQGR